MRNKALIGYGNSFEGVGNALTSAAVRVLVRVP